MKQHHSKFWRWLPVIAPVALMLLVAVVSIQMASELKRATYWREHTFKVILDAQTVEDNMLSAESRVNGYAKSGAGSLLVEYKSETNTEMKEFNELASLTSDNPAQQQRLKELSAAVNAVFQHDNDVIGIYARQGSDAALRTDESKEVEGKAVADLEKFSDVEKQLLAKRDATEQADYHRAAWVLIGASVLVAVLLVMSNYVANRETNRRKLAESKQKSLIEELQRALAEVKTLSGLIPICAWCKSVRNDKGYWSTVEQYVRTHTDATFTHGMCPDCQRKFEEDIEKAKGVVADKPAP
jgi:CHASE3 domain sensor protein